MKYDISDSVVNYIPNVPNAEMCQWYCVQLFDCDYFTYFSDIHRHMGHRRKCVPLKKAAEGTGVADIRAIRGPKICHQG